MAGIITCKVSAFGILKGATKLVLLILCNLLNIASGACVCFCTVHASCHGISLALCSRIGHHSLLDTVGLNIMCSYFQIPLVRSSSDEDFAALVWS
jgi:hypothetical protein